MSVNRSAVFQPLCLGLIFGLFFVALTASISSAHARKPAVEAFVGVETEAYQETPPGTEFSFNFGNTTQAYAQPSSSRIADWTPAIGLATFLMLPMLMWFGIMRTSKEASGALADNKNFGHAPIGATQNVASLSSYKESKEEKLSKDENGDEDEFKKVS